MNISSAIFFVCVVGSVLGGDCPSKKTTSKLVCYYGKLTHVDSCKCSHVILPPESDVKSIDRIREHVKGVKILITVNEFNQGLVNILKSSKVDGIEINLKKLDSKNDISDFISTVRSKLGSDLYIVVSVPAKAETLAKYYNFKVLSKSADLFVLQTAFLGASKNVTFHPSRLSGLWDMQNTDSVVDLVSGLGAPLSKLVITAPVQAFRFKLQSEKHTAPGSPALEIESITRDELCAVMGKGGNWTLERDQDQAGPYIFSQDQWIAFDDPTSIDIKAKYARVRGLAGLALKDLSQDGGTKCESSILDAAFQGLSRQARAPRGAVLHSLEREILETPARPLDTIQVSPYRISRVIDVEGNVHVIRKDTRTEFECARQGYFVHPRSCGRFYRCVKFDQLSDEFSVFEFDCPAGLAFDARVEVCVWPGSLSHASPCSGSSEIAPVPRERFICPNEPGYYADPENCRWFFACLDHGKSPLSAYEFRCPFGLVYDQSRLLCEWPWLVPKCGSGYAVGSEVVYGGSGGVALDQYNGLGVLGVTSLGGLQGPLQQPVAKVYSNVGLISQGDNYVTGNGQLSLKAAQSLQNAGLLRSGYNLQGSGLGYAVGNGGLRTTQIGSGLGYAIGNGGVRTSQIGSGLGYAIGNGGLRTAQIGSGLVYTNGQDDVRNGAAFGTRLQQVGLGLVHSQGQGSGLNTAYRGEGYAQNSGASLVNTGLYQGANLQTNYGNGGLGLAQGNVVASVDGANLNYQTGNAAIVGTHSSDGYIGTTNAHLVNGLAGNLQSGVVANGGYEGAKSTVEYHGSSGTSGNINIVGGGYSAVGVAGEGNYENSATITHVTQSPISVAAVSSIPTVTSVPVPALKVASGFQGYNGGVVANVPELQYKVQGNVASSRGSFGIANVSRSFVNLVSSTPSTIIQDGYQYPKPTVAFVEEPTLSVQQNLASVHPVVTTYQKPVFVSTTQTPVTYQKTSFVQHITDTQPITTYQRPIIEQKINLQPVVTTYQKPVFVSTTQTPVVVEKVNIQPVVSTYNVQKQDASFVGYDYPKPTINFEEAPRTTGGSFSYQNVDLINRNEGYTYSKPAVAFEEVPLKTVKQAAVSTFTYSAPSTVKPVTVVEQVQLQPTVHTVVQQQPRLQVTSYNVPSSTVRPVIVEQHPQVYVSSTPATIQPIIKQQPVTFTNFQRHEIVQPQLQVTSYNVPSSTVRPVVVEQSPHVYVSSTPATIQQQAVTFTNFQKHETAQPQLQVVQQRVQPAVVSSFSISSNSEGYHYDKPSIAFEEKPITYQQAAIQKTVIATQPVVSTYNYQAPVSTYNYKNVVQSVANQGYSYPQPAVAFEEVPASVTRLNYVQKPVVSSYSYTAPSTVVHKQAPVVTSYTYDAPSTVKPAVFVQQPTYVSSTPKSAIFLQKQPAVVSSYSYVAPSTYRPAVVAEPVVTYTPKPVVNSYSYVAPSTVRPAVVAEPIVTYTPKPAVVNSYSYVAPSTVRPAVVAESIVTYTPKPVVRTQPAVVSRYSISSQPVQQFSGYDYPKPVVPFVEEAAPVVTSYENRQPVEEVPFVAKKAYVTGGQSSYQYNQQLNNVVNLEQKPLVVENYQAPIQVVSSTPLYEAQQKVVLSSTPRYEYKQQYSVDSGYVYDKPAVAFEERPLIQNYQVPLAPKTYNRQRISSTPRPIVDYAYIQSTPKPTFVSTIDSVVEAKQPFTFYDSRITSTARPVTYSTSLPVVDQVSTSRPISRFSFGSQQVDNQYQQVDNQYQQVDNQYQQVSKTVEDYVVPVEVTTAREYLPATSRPIAKYSFSSLDAQYQQDANLGRVVENYVAPIEVTTPARDYLPVRVTTSTPEVVPVRIKVTTSAPEVPTREYLPVRSRVRVPEVTREYLPVRSRVRVTTPVSTYLPVDDYEVSTRRPVKVVKVARPQTIVKVNDYHPLLSAKLGAQCTCVSNSVKLRKQPLRIVVDDDDDGYVVDNGEGVAIENYQYEPQKIVEITPTPEVYIKSTTEPVELSSPVYTVRKRVRVRPATSTVLYEAPVTEAAQLFVKKVVTPIDDLSVTNDLSSVEGVSLQSRKFDRYGPGGWRSRNEKLQGTIDCQRAGLFRHPTQCNKFYACRWDCTKNRYTLHVFNCPVHLTFDNNLGACNWPSQGPACLENTLLPSD